MALRQLFCAFNSPLRPNSAQPALTADRAGSGFRQRDPVRSWPLITTAAAGSHSIPNISAKVIIGMIALRRSFHGTNSPSTKATPVRLPITHSRVGSTSAPSRKDESQARKHEDSGQRESSVSSVETPSLSSKKGCSVERRACLSASACPRKRCKWLLADKGYASEALRRYCDQYRMHPVIPMRSMKRKPKPGLPRLFDRPKYRQRNILERIFDWLIENRRIVTRLDKLAK